ncbi:hypothetical protein KL86DPRO_11198 [uncultured delta proteobacterium]|uniref:Uncharacterized protein n=1 Tax=uncultured delta proteobacterium TaxID=34034 RepID=A0A212JD13_9DELT|nr:hypothetical protein KL86DPRO_11198 [uncultured delta proteobacterium]
MTSTTTFEASGAAGPLVYIPMAHPGERAVITAKAGHDLYFAFFPAVVTSARAGNDLVFAVEGGGIVVVRGFFAVYRDSFPKLLLPDGTAVAAEDFFEGSTFDLHTAAGPVSSDAGGGHGAWAYRDDAGSLLTGVSRLGHAGSAGGGVSRFADGSLDASLGAASGDMPGVLGGRESFAAMAAVSSRPDTPGASDAANQTPGGPPAGPGEAEAGENSGGASPGGGEGGTGDMSGSEAGSGTETDRPDETGDGTGGAAGNGKETGREDGAGEEGDPGNAGGAEAGNGAGEDAGSENDAGDTGGVSGGFESVPDGSTGVVPIADGRLTVQAVTIRIMGGVAEVASTDARLSVDENGLLGVASEQSWGDADTLDAWEGLVITCGDGGGTSRMDIDYTVATWDGSVYYQLYDADGNLMGWPVQVDLPCHAPGTEGTLSIIPPAGYEDFASVMLYANGACRIAFSGIETTFIAGESAVETAAGADAAAGLNATAGGPENTGLSEDADSAGQAEDAGADFFGWDEAIPFYTGLMDCMMDPVMLDASGLPPYDPFGLSGHAAGFSLEGFPDLENDVLTLVTSRDGAVVTQKIDIHFVDDTAPGTGSAIQPLMAAAGSGHPEMEGDCGLQEQVLNEILIKTTTC